MSSKRTNTRKAREKGRTYLVVGLDLRAEVFLPLGHFLALALLL